MPILTPEERVGTVLAAKYRLDRIIATGGMATVFAGLHAWTERAVAVKILNYEHARDPEVVRRFLQEARAAAQLKHPNVVDVLDMGQDPADGSLYIVQELLVGEDLRALLEREGKLDEVRARAVFAPVLRGIAAAHAAGIVHRDVKPANIFLEKGVERVVITDFGLARAADDVSMTRQGVVAGTPEYMSPEQARGEALDGRSDLFSLGCVLYEMATGVSPFRTDSTLATLRRIVDEQPAAMASLVPELPPWFSHIVERLLSKVPAQRFASASEVSQLLEQCLSHLQQPTTVRLPAFCESPRTSWFGDRMDRWFGSKVLQWAIAVVLAVASFGLLTAVVLDPLRALLLPSPAPVSISAEGHNSSSPVIGVPSDATMQPAHSGDPFLEWNAVNNQLDQIEKSVEKLDGDKSASLSTPTCWDDAAKQLEEHSKPAATYSSPSTWSSKDRGGFSVVAHFLLVRSRQLRRNSIGKPSITDAVLHE